MSQIYKRNHPTILNKVFRVIVTILFRAKLQKLKSAASFMCMETGMPSNHWHDENNMTDPSIH